MNKVYVIIGMLALALVSFMGGAWYEKAKFGAQRYPLFDVPASLIPGSLSGQVIAITPASFTLQVSESQKIVTVLVSSATSIQEATVKKINEIPVGQKVILMGNPNDDGSITARTVQLVPSTTPLSAPSPAR